MSDETIKNAERAYQRAVASGQIRERPAGRGLKRYTAADFKNSNAAPMPAAGQTTTHVVDNDGGAIILEIHVPRN